MSVDTLPNELIEQVYFYLPVSESAKLVDAIPALKGSEDWGRVLQLKYPAGQWRRDTAASDAIRIDDALQNLGTDKAVSFFFHYGVDEGTKYLLASGMTTPFYVANQSIVYDDDAMLEHLDTQYAFDINDRLPHALEIAGLRDSINVAKYLVNDKGFDSRPTLYHAFIRAMVFGKRNLAVVKYFVSLGVDPTMSDNQAIVSAASGGFDILKYIASLPGVDPTARGNQPIINAIRENHLDAVKHLVSLGADPSARNNQPIIIASREGYLDIVKYLASFESVDPAARDNEATMRASKRGRADIVKYLASCEPVDPTARDNEALVTASANGHLDVVEYLASLPAVNAGAKRLALFSACQHGHLDVVKCLASLPDVDAKSCKDEAYVRAADNFHQDVIDYLARVVT